MSYEPIGFYVTCDDAECADCHDPAAWQGFEGWEEPLAIFRDTEMDTPTHCVKCRSLIPHALTADGYDYVSEAWAEAGGYAAHSSARAVLDAWRDAYL